MNISLYEENFNKDESNYEISIKESNKIDYGGPKTEMSEPNLGLNAKHQENPNEIIYTSEKTLDKTEYVSYITNEVNAILKEIIDYICFSNMKLNDTLSENMKTKPSKEQIVIHVGATNEANELDLKFFPQIAKLKNELTPEVVIQPKFIPIIPETKSFDDIIEDEILPLPKWMPQPPTQPNCPFGLEYLSAVDTIKISQTNILPRHNDSSFIVNNNVGQHIYQVKARTSCLSNFLCASRRKYEMSLLDYNNTEVMNFLRTSERCGWRSLEVYASFNTLIGKIIEDKNRGSLPIYNILDPINEVLFRVVVIASPPESNAYIFGVMPTDGDNLVGKIKQESNGTLKKLLRNNFMTVQYFINLDAKIKALILGASFLIDLIYFEIC